MASTKLIGKDKEAKLKAKQREQKKTKQQAHKGPVKYFKEVVAELKKVTWPTFKDLMKHTGAVLVFILVVGVVIFGMDTGLRALWNLLLK